MDQDQDINIETVSSLKNCISLAHNILKVGTETAEELEKQDEQLDRINGNVNIIDDKLRFAHRTLDNISSFIKSLFGAVSYNGNNIPNHNDNNNANDNMTNKNEDDNQKDIPANDDLDELYNLTLKMEKLSVTINKALDKQTGKIQSISNKVDSNNDTINLANDRIDKLL